MFESLLCGVILLPSLTISTVVSPVEMAPKTTASILIPWSKLQELSTAAKLGKMSEIQSQVTITCNLASYHLAQNCGKSISLLET